MFSKSKINEPGAGAPAAADGNSIAKPAAAPSAGGDFKATAPKPKPPASILSADLHIIGNLKTSGDIQVEGQIDGDIRAHLLTIGEGAVVRGEVIADDVVINGHVIGCVRGLKVRLTSSAQFQGDIIHKTIAIESGANFEGNVTRQEDPLSAKVKTAKAPAPAPTKGAS